MLTILPTVGLFLDVAGAALVGYVSTKPVYIHWTGEEYRSVEVRTGNVTSETKGAEIRPKPEDTNWLRAGWTLIALGFLLQLAG